MKHTSHLRKFFVGMLILLCFNANAQLAQYHIGSSGNELATKVKTMPDGSVIIAGYNYTISGSTSVNCQAIIMRVDNSYSTILWQKSFTMTGQNANANNIIRDMIITHDSNIVVVGTIGDDGPYQNNHAAIVKFKASNGAEMWHTIISDAVGFPADYGGEVFAGVTELGLNSSTPQLSYALVAVGTHNLQPTTADGLVSVFTSTGVNLNNETYPILDDFGDSNGDDFSGVVTAANGTDVYACGEYATGSGSGTYKNGRVMQYTPGVVSGTVGWTKFFDFTLVMYTTTKAGADSIYLNNNFFDKIYRVGGTLLLHGGCLNTYSYTASADFVLKLNAVDGSDINLRQLYFEPGTPDVYENNTNIAVRDANHIYDVQTPSTTLINSEIWTLGGSGDADVTDITDLDAMTNHSPVRFKGAASGFIHSVEDVDLNSNDLFMAGSENENYFGTVQNNDIYYAVTATSGTEFASINKANACDTADDSMQLKNIVIDDIADVQYTGTFTATTYSLTYVPINDSIAQVCGDNFGGCYDSGKLVVTTTTTVNATAGTGTVSATMGTGTTSSSSETGAIAVSTVTVTAPPSDTCNFTATVTVGTSNIIYGYGWSVNGVPVILDHTGSGSDSYTFTVLPGGEDIISVTAYIVNPNFTQNQGSPCCEAVFTDTLRCPAQCTAAFDSALTNVTYSTVATPVGCDVTCDANASVNPGWTVVKYVWSGSYFTTVTTYPPTNHISHILTAPSGVVSVTIYAVDAAGDTCTITRTITVACGKSTACIETATITATYISSFGKDCLFKCTASATAGSGYYIADYVWSYLGSTYTDVGGPSDTRSIGVPSGISAIITVTVNAVNNATGDTCKKVLTIALTCEKGGGIVGRDAKTGDNSGDGSNLDETGGINVYPNPTQNSVTVSSIGDDNIKTIQVIDVNGKKVGDYSYDENTKSVNVSLTDLVPGTYLLRINGNTSKIVTKVN